MAGFLFLNVPPYVGHLWYLLAMMTVYVVLWIYTCFFGKEAVDYRPLYAAAICLLACNFVMGGLFAGIEDKTIQDWCRTGVFTGIPMFMIGMFLREYQQRILENFNLTTKKQLALLFMGILLTLIQWRGKIHTGNLAFGMVISLIGLMMLLVTHPVVVRPDGVAAKCIARFGVFSTALYIIHLMVVKAYGLLMQETMEAQFGSAEPWLRPLVVLVISLIAAFVWERMDMLEKKLRKHR